MRVDTGKRGAILGITGLIIALAGATAAGLLAGGVKLQNGGSLQNGGPFPDSVASPAPPGKPPKLHSQPAVADVPFFSSPMPGGPGTGPRAWSLASSAARPSRLPRPSVLPSGSGLDALASRDEIRALGLRIRVDEERRVEFPIESLFALPGDSVEIRASDSVGKPLEMWGGEEEVHETGVPGRWVWVPDSPTGHTVIHLRHPGTNARVRLHAFTMVPAEEVADGRLNGYRIGNYPREQLNGDPIYRPPRGFVEVTEANADVRVSPHFQLMHFPAKQPQGYPKYLVLRPALLKKLEWVLEAMVDRGYPVQSFYIMSGYRTPYYNVQILGNSRYSRHQWGGAADVFVDERPRNGMMDDLDGDGRVTLEDARKIHAVVDSLELDMGSTFPVGGLGLYAANSVRGPFVHMDVRGRPARW